MKLKGIDKFREKLPVFSGKKIIILPIYCFLVFTGSLIIQLYFDLIPSMIPFNSALGYFIIIFPVLGVILMGSVGLFLVYQMWDNRDRLKAKYGQLSYQRIFFIGFGGVVIIFSIVVNNLIPFYKLDLNFWSQFPFSIFTTPLTSYFTLISSFLREIRFFLGVFFCILGIITMVRAIETFGLDYMAVIYLYFPEESELEDHKIYSILRHPAYSGLILLSLGGMIIQLTLYSIIFFLILYFGMYIHIHFVEDKELINRFGDSYNEYRKTVPAFFVQLKNWGQFFKFILGKE
ncbi:MAG: methyltransferase family protein [Candidatus Thorarchaeota archaeon]